MIHRFSLTELKVLRTWQPLENSAASLLVRYISLRTVNFPCFLPYSLPVLHTSHIDTKIVTYRGVRVLDRTIGFIGTSVTVSLNYNQYSSIADLHTFQSTVAHALGFSVFASHLLTTDLNTETSTSNHHKVFLLFRLPSLCTPLS
jgi:hypothetical protein